MTPEQIKEQEALMLSIKNQVTEIVTEKTKASNETIENLKSQILELKAKSADNKDEAITKEVERLAGVVKAMGEEGKKTVISKEGSFADNVVKAFSLLKKEEIENFKRNPSGRIILKSATTETTSNIDAVGTNSIPFTLSANEPGLSRVVRRQPFIFQLCNTGGTNKMYVQWAEQRNPDGGAGTTSEGSGKTQADFDIQEVSAKVEKITSYMKVSKEMLDDVDFMAAEIRNELTELIALKLDAQILGGDGSTPNLNGIITQASTFAGTPFVNAVDYATRWDVLRVAVNQIARATGGDTNYAAGFVPNYIILNPDDVAALELTKTNTYGMYVIPPFAAEAGSMIAGCKVIANAGMTSGSFLVGDFTKANVRIREGASISMGYDGSDFTNNLVTILAELRAVSYIKGNHTKAFVYGASFTAAIASLKDAKS